MQYRVARGRAYEPQKGQRNISTLQWHHSEYATTQFGEVSEISGDPPSHVLSVLKASTVPRVSIMA